MGIAARVTLVCQVRVGVPGACLHERMGQLCTPCTPRCHGCGTWETWVARFTMSEMLENLGIAAERVRCSLPAVRCAVGGNCFGMNAVPHKAPHVASKASLHSIWPIGN